jgi:hypothetical protein
LFITELLNIPFTKIKNLYFKVTADFDENGSDDRDGTIWLEPKFHIRTKIKLEEFDTSSRFSEWWVSSKLIIMNKD